MKKSYLLHSDYKKMGWIIFIPSLILGFYISFSDFQFSFLECRVFNLFQSNFLNSNTTKWFDDVNLTNTILGILVLVGAMLVGFSKEKHEDEYIAQLRLSALLWSVLVNYSLLILAFILMYDISFFKVMTYNMFTVLLLFIFKFHYLLYRSKIGFRNDK